MKIQLQSLPRPMITKGNIDNYKFIKKNWDFKLYVVIFDSFSLGP